MNAGRLGPIFKAVDRQLRDPIRIRFVVAIVMLSTWYFVAFAPLSEEIARVERTRIEGEAQLKTALEVEALRAESGKFEARLPARSDPNEWVEYILAGVRKFPIRLLKLEPLAARKHGPFDVVSLRIELTGAYADLRELLSWIETNPRLLRVDSIDFDPNKKAGELQLQVTILGLMGQPA